MLRNLFKKLLSRFPAKDIGDGAGDIFFWRYTLAEIEPRTVSGFDSAFLHQFLRGDKDRCLHDHPWDFLVIILWGGYWEEMKDGRHWRGPGSILYRPAATAHRIDVEPGTHPWSLVLVRRKTRPWGFHGPNGWVPWRKGEPNPICEVNS